jgi:endonuclease I
LVHWAKVDTPSAWELAYNNWVYARQGIRNPFIDTPENALQLLDNRDLLASIEYRQ